MKFLSIDFRDAKQEIEKYLPGAQVSVKKASQSSESMRDYVASLWMRGDRLNGGDPASRYLASRGIVLNEWPSQLRYISEAAYKHDDGRKTRHPAMVARFHGPDAKEFTTHMTFLTVDGQKANLPKVRKLAPLSVPVGGAVRLANSSETMGIAERIETALSASLLFDVPVWAALSAGAMMKWKPPASAKNILIFGDNDENFAGHMAAYSLAYSLLGQKYQVEVRIPDETGSDWNDALIGGYRSMRRA